MRQQLHHISPPGVTHETANVEQVEAAEALRVRAEAVDSYLPVGVTLATATEADVVAAEAAANDTDGDGVPNGDDEFPDNSLLTTVESTGDPYITPLHGNVYKLPNYTANYRAFEYDDVFINVLVDHLDITDEFNRYIKRSNLESQIELGTTPITSGYWNSKLYIESEGHSATLDIENKQLTYNTQYFNLKIIDKKENSMFVEDGQHKALAIEWTHTNYGKQCFIVSYYENPQHRNGLKFQSKLIYKKSATGILIRNYKPKFMTLNKLETGYSKKLIAKSKAANNLIIDKVISSKEKWISNKGTKTSKQVNKKYLNQ